MSSAAGALEFAHEAGEGFNGGGLEGVVKRDAHAADGAVSEAADESGRGCFIGEHLFNGVVSPGYTEDCVHFRSRSFFYGAGIEAAAGFDSVVKHPGFSRVALFHSL